jgi:hypothetical protein
MIERSWTIEIEGDFLDRRKSGFLFGVGKDLDALAFCKTLLP